jgi:ATP-dependent protease ClpP protease subunit
MIRLPSNVATMRHTWRVANEVPATDRPSWSIKNAAGARPKLYVYDVIGGWDLDASEFVQTVHAIDADAIDLHINSPGGFVYDAVAMYEALEQHAADVHVKIDGLAASAASFLAMVGDTRTAARGARGMIHDAQIVAWGSPATLREAADLADAVSDDIAGYYSARAGGKPTTWRAAMTAETWYSAQQMVDVGLVDSVSGAEKDDPADVRDQAIRARHRARVTVKG